MPNQIYTEQEIADILLSEGHVANDVTVEMNTLIRAGLALSQPHDASLLTGAELDLLRMRLREQGE